MKQFNVKAEWSGAYPCLCCGEWSLFINGKNFTKYIPSEKRNNPMDTFNTYQTWYFDEDYMEIFEDYEDGLTCEEWIEENKDWLNKITTNSDELKTIYEAFKEQDFRTGSCGGCI